MKKVFLAVLSMFFLSAGIAAAADEASWLPIGGGFPFWFGCLKGSGPGLRPFSPTATGYRAIRMY